MKIKIELTKTEAAKIKKTTKTVTKELVNCMTDEDNPTTLIEYYKDYEGKIDGMFNKSAKGKPGTYMAETNDNGSVTISLDLKGTFINDLSKIIEIFYVQIAKVISNIIKPFTNFCEKYFE